MSQLVAVVASVDETVIRYIRERTTTKTNKKMRLRGERSMEERVLLLVGVVMNANVLCDWNPEEE